MQIQAAAAQMSTLNMASSAVATTANLQTVDPSAGPGGSTGAPAVRASSDTALVSEVGQHLYAASLSGGTAGTTASASAQPEPAE
jgi:hypothetical protein